MTKTKIWPPTIIGEPTEAKDWKTYSYEYGIKNGLNKTEAETFSNLCSQFIENGAVVTNDHREYKIQKMQFDILATMQALKMSTYDSQEQAKFLFEFIFKIFNENIYDYTKKSEKISFRLTRKQYEMFMSLPGKDKADKLETLLEAYKEK